MEVKDPFAIPSMGQMIEGEYEAKDSPDEGGTGHAKPNGKEKKKEEEEPAEDYESRLRRVRPALVAFILCFVAHGIWRLCH